METLRDFSISFTAKHRLRGASDLFGLKREAIRKFNEGLTVRPRDSTRQKMAEAYLAFLRAGAGGVRESMSGVLAPDPGELRVIFKDREDAHRKLRLLKSDEPSADGREPAWVTGIRSYLLRDVDSAYSTEPTVYETPRPARKSPSAGAAPRPATKGTKPKKGNAPSPPSKPPPRKSRRRKGGGDDE